MSDPFDIRSGVEWGFVLAPTLFGISFPVLLEQTFGNAAEGIYLRTRLDTKLKVQMKCLRDLLFADGAAVTAHSAKDLQQLMNRFSKACQDFVLTISLKKTQVMAQDMESPPNITILGHKREVVHDFVYLG